LSAELSTPFRKNADLEHKRRKRGEGQEGSGGGKERSGGGKERSGGGKERSGGGKESSVLRLGFDKSVYQKQNFSEMVNDNRERYPPMGNMLHDPVKPKDVRAFERKKKLLSINQPFIVLTETKFKLIRK
jgi:hypothetical protein